MSEKLCALRKIGGGTLKETVLWTNLNPTSQMGDNTTLTLSENINNFKFIQVVARFSTSDATTFSAIMSVEDFLKSGTTNKTRLYFGGIIDSNYCRTMRYTAATSVRVSTAYIFSGTSYNNAVIIPTQIIGLK